MYQIYQIQSGDNLDNISKMLNTTIENLMKLNGLGKNIELIPGGFLIVPKIDSRFTKYIVKAGDNIYNIADENNVDYKMLLNLNGLEKEDYIYPNQEILIPSKEYKFYITKDGDTLKSIMNNLEIDYENILDNNEDIYLIEDQVIIYR